MRSFSELGDLTGRTAIITGGAGHLGGVFAETLLELGANILLVDIHEGPLEQICSSLAKRDGVAYTYVDVADVNATKALPRHAVDRFGSLDILINNASLVGGSKLEGWSVPFEVQSIEAWHAALDVNLTPVFTLSQAAAPYLRQSGRGVIINIGSIYGISGPDWRLYEGTSLANPAAYGATKGAVVQFTRWLATTLAPSIRVNCISPGGIFRNHTEPFLGRYCDRTPLSRMASEEDFKGAIGYLASDLSEYVTGHNLVVDGGWTTW